jgi:hypothetical protein
MWRDPIGTRTIASNYSLMWIIPGMQSRCRCTEGVDDPMPRAESNEQVEVETCFYNTTFVVLPSRAFP